MAIRVKLGRYETVTGDPLGRGYVGYFPRMTEEEAWEAGRGVWKVNAYRAVRQRFAVVVGEGVVRAVAEITDITTHTTPSGERHAFQGQVLPADHPIREAHLGRPDPVTNGSQNPVGYCDLDGEDAFLQRPCACGCGDTSDRDFLPGHDIRAIQQRVREQFGGSPLALIRQLDKSDASTAKTTISGHLAGFLAQVTGNPHHHDATGPVDVYFRHDTLTPSTHRALWDHIPRTKVPAEGTMLTMRGHGYQGTDAHWQVLRLQWLDGTAVIAHVTDAPATTTA